MQTPLQLTFRNVAHSDALATQLKARVAKLDHLFDRIISCHVVIDLEGHHHHYGDRFRISINVGLPGHELIVSLAPSSEHEAESVSETADRAFDDAERQLGHWVRRPLEQRHHAPAARPSN